MRTGNRGFTLLEIMIALAVFAIAAAALVKNASLGIRQTALLQDKTLAYWIAENEVAQLRTNIRFDEDFPAVTSSRSEAIMANRYFDVETKVENTENPDVHRIDVVVFRKGEPEDAVARLSSFVGRY